LLIKDKMLSFWDEILPKGQFVVDMALRNTLKVQRNLLVFSRDFFLISRTFLSIELGRQQWLILRVEKNQKNQLGKTISLRNGIATKYLLSCQK
jgi:hypothetical protein